MATARDSIAVARPGRSSSGDDDHPLGVDVEPLVEQLFRFIHFVTMAGQSDVFGVMAELDLSVSQLRALFILDGAEPDLAVHELAQLLDLSVAAAGRAVEVLVRAGLVSRREDEVDRRVKRIAITQAGRETMQRLATAKRDGLVALVGMLDEDERPLLSQALQRVLDHSEVQSFESRHCCL